MAHLLPLLGLSLLAGCGTPVTPPAADAVGPADVYGKPTLTIGGANDDGFGFVQWHEAPAHPKIVSGLQGGQHIWVSMRSQNLWPEHMAIAVVMHDAATGALVEPGEVNRMLKLLPRPGYDTYEGFVAYVSKPCAIAGKKVRVEMTVRDLYGVTAQDSAEITPVWGGLCAP